MCNNSADSQEIPSFFAAEVDPLSTSAAVSSESSENACLSVNHIDRIDPLDECDFGNFTIENDLEQAKTLQAAKTPARLFCTEPQVEAVAIGYVMNLKVPHGHQLQASEVCLQITVEIQK